MKSRTRTKPTMPSKWKMALAAAVPLAAMALLFGAMLNNGPDMAAERERAAMEREALRPVAEALRSEGCDFQSNGGIHRVTVPRSQAMGMSPIQARELALEIRERTGGMVKVLSPAGQVLGEAP